MSSYDKGAKENSRIINTFYQRLNMRHEINWKIDIYFSMGYRIHFIYWKCLKENDHGCVLSWHRMCVHRLGAFL